ncbi:hypothetical protein G3576_25715 [Roseomonas stagni]|uniref:Uncharacterized protein n=1 Tax=Falsiroseomonas algicola TaxID=2716930 RepID=A0A6M1LSK2_9PROT|nr:hypothetical protein [Falsiroseomonas algicola]NGM23436.1 hypothetical protein [Falsiroseomonas algicola]
MRSALAQALEAALRKAMREQPDPMAYLDGIGEDVLPTLLGGYRPDGTVLRDPANAAVVAGVLCEVVTRLRAEWRR